MIADTTTSISWLILIVSVLGWVVYLVGNARRGRAEIGSEIQLAANRKPYYDDDILEGAKIERTQLLGLVFLAIITIALPLYWILEPSREAGATVDFQHRFETWGSRMFVSTAEGGYNCAGCHGGMTSSGGSSGYVITDPITNEVKPVIWKAPALNTLFYRYSESEVRFILEYGRPFSPMSAWGIDGGGPLNEQQVQTLIEYMESIQIPREDCTNPLDDPRLCDGGHLPKVNQSEIQAEAERLVKNGTYATLGESLFNLDLGGGGFSCARCHTTGWSYGEPQITGGGALGPNLTGGSSVRQFPQQSDMVAFIKGGSEFGKRYGQQGQGGGRMPAFGTMLTDEQINAIVDYVRGL